MIEYITTKTISAALLKPAISAILTGAKKAGAKGFQKWEKTQFHSKIQKKISSIESLKTFWSADTLVSLAEFYYPSRVEVEGTKKQFQFISELPDGNIIIEGIVGQGKSIYLRHLATSEIRSNQVNNFPIFIEFRTLSKKIDIDSAIKTYLEDVNIDGFDEETFEYVMSSGKFVLLLDAFDELDDEITKDTYLQLERYIDRYEKLKVIITSRPSAEIQKSSKFKVIRLAPLGESDYTPFLTKLGLEAQLIAEIKKAIRNSPSKVSQLITTPLMLTLVVRAYRSVKEIPENLPDFFEVLFKCVFSGHDSAKPYIKRNLASGLGEKKLQELFEVFCFVCLKNKVTRSLSAVQFEKYFETAIKLLGVSGCEAENFRHDMNKVACLILSDGYENWVFLHKSIMEYYAASFVRKSTEEFAIKFYEFAKRDVRPWFEVLTFLNHIDEYRFNKYFLSIELNSVITDLAFLENCTDHLEFSKYMDKHGMLFQLELEMEDAYAVHSVRIGAGAIRFSTKDVFDKALLSLFDFIGNTENDRAVDEDYYNFLNAGKSANNKVFLNLNESIKLFGAGNFIQDCKIIYNKLKQKEESSLGIIRMHESRCDFLDG